MKLQSVSLNLTSSMTWVPSVCETCGIDVTGVTRQMEHEQVTSFGGATANFLIYDRVVYEPCEHEVPDQVLLKKKDNLQKEL